MIYYSFGRNGKKFSDERERERDDPTNPMSLIVIHDLEDSVFMAK